MAKNQTLYVCQSCGTTSSKWVGRCTGCGSWNSLVEEAGDHTGVGGTPKKTVSKGKKISLETLEVGESSEALRFSTGLKELDRVCGGGLVAGSATLVGGEPGIGKSTLLLQTAARMAETGKSVVYLTGEEAPDQVRLRAARLGVSDAPVQLGAETSLANILSTLKQVKNPDLIIVDSIQTLWTDMLDSAPGTVSQVRTCAQELVRFAKNRGAALIMVGHVTKDGQIAGPKVVEHMVDTVLYFEGDNGHQFRIIRAVKNRFGATDEIGVFEMQGLGLVEVANPSELFLGDRSEDAAGTAVFAGMEGTRPLLVEIQALVAPSHLASPRRAVVGWDNNRLAMILAVLDAHCKLQFGSQDVYLNVAGGLRISEPAADLAVAAALISSLGNAPLSAKQVFFGEISLSGTVRSVSQPGPRLKEAKKLGFNHGVVPAIHDKSTAKSGMKLKSISELYQLANLIMEKE